MCQKNENEVVYCYESEYRGVKGFKMCKVSVGVGDKVILMILVRVSLCVYILGTLDSR